MFHPWKSGRTRSDTHEYIHNGSKRPFVGYLLPPHGNQEVILADHSFCLPRMLHLGRYLYGPYDQDGKSRAMQDL